MKCLVILNINTNEIIAISESKKDIKEYYRTKNFDSSYVMIKVTGERDANIILSQYDDLYLEHDQLFDTVLTISEIKVMYDQLLEERSRIKQTIDDLEHYLLAYSLSNKQKSILLEARTIVQSLKKRKTLFKAIKLDYFLKYIQNQRKASIILKDYIDNQKLNMDNLLR